MGCEMITLTAARLRSLLKYSKATGLFTWLVEKAHRNSIGDVAGCFSCGYRIIGIDNRRYLASRLAWLYVTGKWPKDLIDHKNGHRNDDRFSNLREATRTTNAHNLKAAHRDNVLGFLGVTNNGKRFAAQITVKGKNIYLGQHDSPELAHATYLSAKRRLHEGCTI